MNPKQAIKIRARYDLDDIDRAILQRVLSFDKITDREIAAVLGCSITLVRNRRRTPAFQRALDDNRLTTKDLLAEAALRGARRLRKLVDSPNEDIALKAIRLALDPYLKKDGVQVEIKPVLRFSTTVQPNGSLLQEVLEEDRQAVTLPPRSEGDDEDE